MNKYNKTAKVEGGVSVERHSEYNSIVSLIFLVNRLRKILIIIFFFFEKQIILQSNNIKYILSYIILSLISVMQFYILKYYIII